MFEDLDELEGEFFDISQGECQDYFPGYRTINYGLEYDYNGSSYFLKYIYTEESEGIIGYDNLSQSVFSEVDEYIEAPDKSTYPNPERDLIMRVFEFEWE
jgi:hypothetical protein